MIGLQILLIAISVAVIACIPLAFRHMDLRSAESRQSEAIGRLSARIESISADCESNRTRIARIEGQIAQIDSNPPESAQIGPNTAEIGTLGTNIGDFEPDAAYDPTDGRIPYLNTDWTAPILESDLDEEVG